MYATSCFSLPVDVHLSCFQFGAIMNKAVYEYSCIRFYADIFLIPLEKCPGVNLLGHMVSVHTKL